MYSRTSRRLLIGILQLAWSGELAALCANQGHWNSVGNPEEKSRIRTIEEEEWHHRKLVGEMLWDLGEHPGSWREFKAVIIGRTAGFLCHVTGWLAPMYGAGKLESRNVREYEVAARYARDCGRREFVEPLLTMAEVSIEDMAKFGITNVIEKGGSWRWRDLHPESQSLIVRIEVRLPTPVSQETDR
jgi:hypothetical protein